MVDTVFIVARKGVNYRHELAGAYTSWESAIGIAVACIEAEDDDYHTYEVVALPLGLAPNIRTAGRLESPVADRLEPVAVIKRDDEKVIVERSNSPIPW